MNSKSARIDRRCVLVLTVLILAIPSLGQANALQEKVAALKQSMAQNRQRLMQYRWTETTQLTLKGDPKPPTQDRCQYGPNGKVQKTPLGFPPAPTSGGPLKQKLVEKKKAELQEYTTNAKSLLNMYLPPDDQELMQRAQQSGNISFTPAGGLVNLVIVNYVLQGDKMTITFDPQARKITALAVNTYMDDPKDIVNLQVEMGALPDGTNFTRQTVLSCPAKKLVVTTTNSDYQQVSGS
jgi:hypothetical protein